MPSSPILVLLVALCALLAQAQDTTKAAHGGLAAEAPTKSTANLGACPVGDFQCADGSGCCPTGTVCGTGAASDLCLKDNCPIGQFLCSDDSGCCPNGRTCGTGSQRNLCLASQPASSSSSTLPSWAISLIVIFPLACLAAACRYQMQKRAQPPADAYATFNPAAQGPAPQPAYQATQTAYQGPPSTYQPSAPPAYQGNSGPQQWR
jgi:hypothetical protein